MTSDIAPRVPATSADNTALRGRSFLIESTEHFNLDVVRLHIRRCLGMPEQISKYPDVTLQVLRESGAVCGQGAPQKILKQCPRERFCSLRTGEICVYGINDIPKMTQITSQELAQIVCPLPQRPAIFSAGFSAVESALILALFFGGVAAGKYCRKPPSRVSVGGD
jgi:hypothetical protein